MRQRRPEHALSCAQEHGLWAERLCHLQQTQGCCTQLCKGGICFQPRSQVVSVLGHGCGEWDFSSPTLHPLLWAQSWLLPQVGTGTQDSGHSVAVSGSCFHWQCAHWARTCMKGGAHPLYTDPQHPCGKKQENYKSVCFGLREEAHCRRQVGSKPWDRCLSWHSLHCSLRQIAIFSCSECPQHQDRV